jgi:ribosomal protein S18 acetylase RimI-like enzyme
VNVSEARDQPRAVDEAALIWAEATAARDGDGPVASLAQARPIIQAVLDRSERSLLLMAWADDGTAAGFAAIEPAGLDQPDQAELTYLGVRPACWGQGVAGAVLAGLRERLTAAGYRRATLSVYVANTRATALYERHGWRSFSQPVPHPRTGKPEQRYELPL